MKKKIYAPFFIGLGLALVSMNGYPKTSHHTVKKHATSSAKRSKVSRKASIPKVANRSRLHASDTIGDLELNRQTSLASVPAFLIETDQPRTEFGAFGNRRIRSVITADKIINFTESGADFESLAHFNSTHGVIETTFADAAGKAGLSRAMIFELTRIFAWDIDFASSLKTGDQFTVIYKSAQGFGNGKNQGNVIAAEFITGGKVLTAVRYKDRNGIVSYYSPEGKSLHKAFLSAPVDFARVSSHFSSHRKHPVLNRIRAHKGVDYAARTGTPVKSAGDGVVSFLGRKGGYGQVLMVKHGDHYETLYAHLSGFKKGLRNGASVRQGDVIGYVGQTGLATGPHLHYEFRIDGVHKNPESLKLDHSMPLDSQQMAEFNSQVRPLLAQLYRVKANSLLAKNAGINRSE